MDTLAIAVLLLPLSSFGVKANSVALYDTSCMMHESKHSAAKLVKAPGLPHATVFRYDRLTNSHPPRNIYLTAIYRCQTGYTLVDPDVSQLYCQQEEWVGIFPVCESTEPEHHSRPTSNQNSYVDGRTEVRSCNYNRGGCSHICYQVEGRVQCRCYQGYYLNSDGRTCSRSPPNVGQMTSSREAQNYDVMARVEIDDPIVYRHMETAALRRTNTQHQQLTDYYDERRKKEQAAEFKSCRINNGGCRHICYPIREGVIQCGCYDGFVLGDDGKSCEAPVANQNPFQSDPAEAAKTCEVNNGGCSHTCHTDGDGRVQCGCFRGFTLRRDGRNCEDVNECKEVNGGCQGLCYNMEGSFLCYCKPGFRLAADQKSCHDENECLLNNGRGPCGDTCRNEIGSFICSCSIPGTILAPNKISCLDIDECADNNYGCSHICKNTYGRAFCSCPEGYTLENDEKTCVDYDECSIPQLSSSCTNGCTNTIGSFVCAESHQLGSTTITTTILPECESGFQRSDNGDCEDINECELGFGCSHTCINRRGTAHCACPKGYRLGSDKKTCNAIRCPVLKVPRNGLIHCSSQEAIVGTWCSFECRQGFFLQGARNRTCLQKKRWSNDGTTCSDINECDEENFGCSHTCTNVVGSAYCACPRGYVLGSNKKTCQDINECAEENFGCSHTCRNAVGSAYCACPKGYALGLDKKTCQDINECAEGNFWCSHTCMNVIGSAYCACPKGYVLGLDKKTCQDVDECAVEGRHNCHHRCENTPGSYTCSCLAGYVMLSNNTCEGCRKNSFRAEGDILCVECPANSYTEGAGKSSASDCICNPGFIGDPGIGIPCTDIDECEDTNFGCSDQCVNTPGSVHCSCPLGFMLDTDKKTCIDIDECSINNGGCDGGCVNTEGDFICNCSKGFAMSSTDKYSCIDIDECQANNGGCSQNCVNFAGGRYCTCNDGYRLDASQRLCIVVTCPRVAVPRNSVMRCLDPESKNLPQDQRQDFPSGTTCTFKCHRGYKMNSIPGYVTCAANGKWEGTVPECLVLQCPPLEPPANGNLQPPACMDGRSDVGQRCYFTCHKGYRLTGDPVLTCKPNLNWLPVVSPICKEEKVRPHVECPPDIRMELPIRRKRLRLRLPDPVSNVNREHITVYPEWARDPEVDFPAGVTDITFVARHPSNPTATDTCEMRVDIMDREPPIVYDCPDSFDVLSDSPQGVAVNWKEPTFTDNVEVTSLLKSLEPGSTFTSGLHAIKYIAKDEAGNSANCAFLINVTHAECSELAPIEHGDLNCMDFILGISCAPSCHTGYMFYSIEPSFYMCNYSGVWYPSDKIQECTRFIPAPESGCLPGSELRRENDTDTRICVECPPGMPWSPTNRTCSDLSFGSNATDSQWSTCKECDTSERSDVDATDTPTTSDSTEAELDLFGDIQPQ